ncbi:ComF family protein [Flavimarina sp. Hel_I_48]|uniref:ComF family protein n=1 Tax=Flavimarina sp. Hel_I_48 TaxID=1392488 RepID=UPI0004DFC8B9|nr:phosphoribosyltransferase family protein [Flavimarina sp. Hel_I_48]
MANPLQHLFNLFFPASCLACDAVLQPGERLICTQCRHDLPVTGLHYTTQKPIHELLYGRVEIEHASALFYFDKKSKVQQLIHNLKYRNYEELSGFLGKWLGFELSELEAYQDIDCVIPVPLHKSRLRERGYNQVTGFGQAIADLLEIPLEADTLLRTKKTKTQVFMTRVSRSKEVIGSFEVATTKKLRGKHILLVDDLITTGGTMEGCAIALQKIPDIKISIAAMAIAHG